MNRLALVERSSNLLQQLLFSSLLTLYGFSYFSSPEPPGGVLVSIGIDVLVPPEDHLLLHPGQVEDAAGAATAAVAVAARVAAAGPLPGEAERPEGTEGERRGFGLDKLLELNKDM